MSFIYNKVEVVLGSVGEDLKLAAVLLQKCLVVHNAEGRFRIEAFLLSVLDLKVYAETLAFLVVL